jgi:predicted enzyme related to lactoylglutathione lyase
MSRRTSRWPAGVPCWVDVTVPDMGAAQAFYGAVLGWSFAETGGEYGGYVIAQVDGDAAAGIGPPQAGAPSAWTLYLASDDVDATFEAVAANGGTVVLAPGDVGPIGRMGIALDPTGAAFGVWQAGEHIGAGVTNEPGGLNWEDLRTPEPARAWDFYRAVFGHRIEALPEAGPDYALFFRPDEQAPLGGMGGMFGAEGPAHWLVYFNVADTDAAVAAARRTGGSVVSPAADSPYGRIAVVTDPAGAVFALIQPAPGDQPDRSG